MKSMKRTISALLALIMLLTVAPVGVAAAGDVAYEVGANILTDGGFELAEQMWMIGGIFTVDKSTVKSGYRALKIGCDGKANQINSSPAVATVAQTYRLSFWLKTQDLAPIEALEIGLMQNGWPAVKMFFDGTSDWHYVEMLTPGKVSNTLNMYIATKEGSSGTAWIDDVTICPMEEIVYEAEKADKPAAESIFSDISDSRYAEEIGTLYALGLMNGTAPRTFSPLEGTKRGDFATVILRLMGIETSDEVQTSAKKSYSDVPADSPYYKAVSTATALGFMNGHDDGSFKPNAEITVNEAIKVFVRMLKQDARAETQGGYPAGYYTVAKMTGLLDGLEDAKVTEAISRQQLAMLIYNLLEADGYIESGFTPDQVILDGYVPFAESYLDIDIKKGIVTANEYTSLNSAKGTEAGKVLIDGKRFNANGTNAGEYLGYRVKYYSKKSKNGTDDTLLYVKPVKEFNETITLTADQIGSAQLTADRKFTISYIDQNGKAKMVKLGLDTNVIFNGVYNPSPKASDFAPEIGSVTFVDNGDDNIFDMAIIESAIAYRVSTVSTSKKFISDKNGKPDIDLDADNLGFEPSFTKDGMPITLADIKKDDLLFVYQSKRPGDVKTEIEVYNNKKTGTITKITGDKEIVIAAYRCELSDVLFLGTQKDSDGNVSYTKAKTDSLRLGDNGTVWLDKDGKVVDFDFEAFKDVRYGYLVDRALVDETFSSTAKLRIFDEDGSFYDYDVAENIYLDGQKIKGEKVVDTGVVISLQDGTTCANPVVKADGKAREQLIKYKINGLGQISSIDTVKVGVNEEAEESLCCEDDDRSVNRAYFASSATFSTPRTAFAVQSTTKVFTIPTDGYKAERQMDFKVGGMNVLRSGWDEYKGMVYDADEFNRANVIILLDNSSDADSAYDAPLMLVTNIGTAFNAEGDECMMFEGMSGGSMTQILSDDTYLSLTSDKSADVEVGDIIRYVKGSNGMLSMLVRAKNEAGNVYDLAGTVYGRFYTGSKSYYSNNQMLFGKVLSRDGDYIIVDVSETGDGSLPMLYVCSNANANVYRYKLSRPNTAQKGSVADISKDDMVFFHLNNTQLMNAVIVEN